MEQIGEKTPVRQKLRGPMCVWSAPSRRERRLLLIIHAITYTCVCVSLPFWKGNSQSVPPYFDSLEVFLIPFLPREGKPLEIREREMVYCKNLHSNVGSALRKCPAGIKALHTLYLARPKWLPLLLTRSPFTQVLQVSINNCVFNSPTNTLKKMFWEMWN